MSDTEKPSKDEKEMTINAMFTNGSRYSYTVKSSETVEDLVNQIKEDSRVTKPEDKSIAVIYRGRILNLKDSWSSIETMNEFAVQIFFRVHSAAPEAPVQELRGLDRLQRMNYTQEQIDEIRRNFHQMRGTTNESAEARMNAEEEWFPVIFNQENPLDALNINLNINTNHNAANQNDNQNGEFIIQAVMQDESESSPIVELFVGFLLGLIFGILSLMVVLINLRDKYMMVGLLFGILGNLALSYFYGFPFL